jgi:hypothetical protein
MCERISGSDLEQATLEVRPVRGSSDVKQADSAFIVAHLRLPGSAGIEFQPETRKKHVPDGVFKAPKHRSARKKARGLVKTNPRAIVVRLRLQRDPIRARQRAT